MQCLNFYWPPASQGTLLLLIQCLETSASEASDTTLLSTSLRVVVFWMACRVAAVQSIIKTDVFPIFQQVAGGVDLSL